MHMFWERVGILPQSYRLLDASNSGDATRGLHLTEVRLQVCVSWMLHFLDLNHGRQATLHPHRTLPVSGNWHACPDAT
jgi:hypothetical protein